MGAITKPVTLTATQVAELSRGLAHMRHDINNQLAMVLAAGEIVVRKPEMIPKVASTFLEQPPRISASMEAFSALFEATLGLSRKMRSSNEGTRPSGGG